MLPTEEINQTNHALCLFYVEREIITFRVHMSHVEKHVRCVQGERPYCRRRKVVVWERGGRGNEVDL